MRAPNVLLALVALVVIGTAVRGMPFLWTDVAEIVDRGLIAETWGQLGSYVSGGIEGAYYRPVIFAVNSLNYWLAGADPRAFRALNALVHVANAVLVHFVLDRACEQRSEATWAALLFAVHPLAVTPLSWASDRTDLLCLFFGLLNVLATLSFARRAAPLPFVLACSSLGLGLGAKEAALCSVLLAAAACLRAGLLSRRVVGLLAGQALVAAAFLIVRERVSSGHAVGESPPDLVEHALLVSRIHVDNAWELLAPWRLRVCDATTLPEEAFPYLAAAACGVTAVCFVLLRNWRSPATFGLVWWLLFLAPTAGFVVLRHVRADRYLYCALPGLLFSALCLLNQLPARAAALVPVARYSIFVYLCAAFVAREERFVSDDALWKWEVEVHPGCAEGWSYLLRSGYMNRDAELSALAARRLQHPPARTWSFRDTEATNLYIALAELDAGNVASAKAALESLTNSGNRTVAIESAYQVGLIELLLEKDASGAIPWFDRSLARGSRGEMATDAHLFRGYAFLSVGDLAQAERDYSVVEATVTMAGTSPMRARVRDTLKTALR